MKAVTRYIYLFLALLAVTSCKKDNNFTVEGVVSGAEGQIMYLENVGVSSVSMLDSVKLNAAGTFEFTQPRPEYPDFYRLRLKNQLINFAVDSTETIKILADAGTFATSYKVEGSENCKAIKTITLAQLDANQAIQKLRKEYEHKHMEDSVYRRKVLEASSAYKEVALKYIFGAPMSTVAYYALFQQVDGLLLFDLYDKKDSQAYGAVATSYDHFYPENPRSKQLHNLALQSIKFIRAQRKLDLSDVKTTEITFLDIELPDLYSTPIKLSEISKGRPVIVNFTAYQAEWSPALNMELNRLYTKYKDNGLLIYQISLDADKHFWMNAASNLPWTCVRDPQTVYSQVASLYNVKQLPAIFILDKKGNIIKRSDNIKQLEKDLEAAL
ncbi:MAG: AhpC/TSA family protein [Parabacteroides sp.]|nr:AhpC/TSA family protein [Parabacteroides sp.]